MGGNDDSKSNDGSNKAKLGGHRPNYAPPSPGQPRARNPIKHRNFTAVESLNNANKVKMDPKNWGIYYYPRSRHPLGIRPSHMRNFQLLHALLSPSQNRNLLNQNSLVVPNAIETNTLFPKMVNLVDIRVDVPRNLQRGGKGPNNQQRHHQTVNINPGSSSPQPRRQFKYSQ